MSGMPGPSRGRPARLSRDQIVAAAMQGDINELTMRTLAARLGVSHSALYRWVRNRDDVLDLISEIVIDRVIPTEPPTKANWQDWLARLAWAMHDEFLAIPGYAARIAQPHRHDAAAFERLRDSITAAFRAAGASREMAAHSWLIFGFGIVNWLGDEQRGLHHGDVEPRFDLFLDALLRGLPARTPVEHRRPRTSRRSPRTRR